MRTFLRGLPDHALLDRLVRGRAWIPLLGVMLAGIVAMQVEVLKFGATIGRAIQRGSVLSVQNQQLRASVATLADEQRVEGLAANMGMVMPPPTAVGFLSARGAADVGRALAGIRTPNASSFLVASTTNGSVVTMATLAAAAPSSPALVSTPASGSSSTATTPSSSGTPVSASTTTTTPGATAPASTTPTGTTQTGG